MPHIEHLSDDYRSQVKKLVILVHEEFGFPYDEQLDSDLDNLSQTYIDSGGAFYVLLEDKTVIGTVAVKKKDETVGEIKRMYIAKPYRGKGYGTQLLEEALSFCIENHFQKCILDTNTIQKDATHLYEKLGFEVVRTEGESIFMEKVLVGT